MAELDPDRTLALSYVPSARRPAVAALWQLDAALGAALRAGREPMISRIKLAWWRESLEKLDRAAAPAEPTLQALAEHVLPAGITGEELAAMEEGWAMLLAEGPLTKDDLSAYARARGAILFGLTARLLGRPATQGQLRAGEAWALVDLGRHSGGDEVETALDAARAASAPLRWPSPLRPLGMLALLARRDAQGDLRELPGAPARMLRMLAHRFTGR